MKKLFLILCLGVIVASCGSKTEKAPEKKASEITFLNTKFLCEELDRTEYIFRKDMKCYKSNYNCMPTCYCEGSYDINNGVVTVQIEQYRDGNPNKKDLVTERYEIKQVGEKIILVNIDGETMFTDDGEKTLTFVSVDEQEKHDNVYTVEQVETSSLNGEWSQSHAAHSHIVLKKDNSCYLLDVWGEEGVVENKGTYSIDRDAITLNWEEGEAWKGSIKKIDDEIYLDCMGWYIPMGDITTKFNIDNNY